MQKLNWKIPIMAKNLGKFVISSTSKIGSVEYFREPTKKEIVEKINEIIEALNK